MNKSGISAIVATVLIILITIAAVAIVLSWFLVSSENNLENSSENNLDNLIYSADVADNINFVPEISIEDFLDEGSIPLQIEWSSGMGDDCIIPGICLTKGFKGLYNSAYETSYNGEVSPADTEWARGFCDSSGIFGPMSLITAGEERNIVSVGNWCLHLVSADLYFDVQFLTWEKDTCSYVRTFYPI